jgi:hypothetical protein
MVSRHGRILKINESCMALSAMACLSLPVDGIRSVSISWSSVLSLKPSRKYE